MTKAEKNKLYKKRHEEKKRKKKETADKRREYFRQRRLEKQLELQEARNRHAIKKVSDNPELLLTKEQPFVEVPETLASDQPTPRQEVMDKEIADIPETIKKIESQNRLIVQQLYVMSKTLQTMEEKFNKILEAASKDVTPAIDFIRNHV